MIWFQTEMHFGPEPLRAFSPPPRRLPRALSPLFTPAHGKQTNNSSVAFPDFVRKAEKRHGGELFRHLNLLGELVGPFPRQRACRCEPRGSAEEEEDAN